MATISLLHFQGADASTDIVDAAGTTWRAVGNAALATAQYKFGSSSLVLDGTGDYASGFPSEIFASSTWTVALWIRPTAIATRRAVICSTNDYRVALDYNRDNTRKCDLYLSSNGTSWDIAAGNEGAGNVGNGNIALTEADWNHVAIVKNGTSFKTFINGVTDCNFTSASALTIKAATECMNIGFHPVTAAVYGFLGYIGEALFMDEALYTGDFTVPAAPYPDPPAPSGSDIRTVPLMPRRVP